MENILEWFAANWWWVTIAAAIVAKLLNKNTPKFSDSAGVTKWLLVVLDVLDVVKVSNTGTGKEVLR